MLIYDATTAKCWVFSFKDGLLSKVGHDLKHRVTNFEISFDPEQRQLEAVLDARSLRVECVLKDGQESTVALSSDDRAEIEKQIIEDVLHADEHPAITFRSTQVIETAEGLHVKGDLTIHGATHPIATTARRIADHYVADVTIHQPTFGIRPFSALLGTLKIKPDVLVRVVVPAR
jgi:hypothetical protein